MSAAANLHPVDMVIDRLRDAGCNPKAVGQAQWSAKCPNVDGHKNGDRNPSLSVGIGADGKVLTFCHKGCRLPDISRALNLGVNDLFPPNPNLSTIGGGQRITATYDYYTEDGEHSFQVVRYTPKGFRQRQKGEAGEWIYKVADITTRPLYMLPQVRKAIEDGKRIYLTEGEKDAEALQWITTGAATCNSGGAGKWRDEYAHQLRGAKRITLFRDNDEAGLIHVKTYAAKLILAGFTDIDVLAPPAPFKDVAEALGAGKAPKDFVHVWDNSQDPSWLTVASEPEPDDHDSQLEVEADETSNGDWTLIDLADIARQIIDGSYQPTTPTILDVEGAMPLFYRERVNLLFGESGGGKTWIALLAVAETAARGERVLLVDYEDNPNGIAERLVILGVPLEHMQYIDYVNPTGSMSTGLDVFADTTRSYSLIVIDSTGEAMAAGSVNSNDDGEVAQWFAIIKRFLRLPGKPCIIALDHVPKNQEGQLLFSIGSQRKRSAITGGSYRVDTIKEAAKGKDGKLKLTVAKDRPGNRAKGSIACHIDLISTEGRLGIRAHYEPMSTTPDGKFRPTGYMERVSTWLEMNPSATAREIRDGVTGKTQVVTEALAVLVAEGFITATSGARGSQIHVVATPFRELTDNPGSLVPCGSQRFPGTTDKTMSSGSPVPPPTRGTGNQSNRAEMNEVEPKSWFPDDSTTNPGSHVWPDHIPEADRF